MMRLVLILFLTLLACDQLKKEDEERPTCHCFKDINAIGSAPSCEEDEDVNDEVCGAVERSCSANRGTYGGGLCSRDGLVGGCSTPHHVLENKTRVYWYYEPGVRGDLTAFCQALGGDIVAP